MKKILLGLCLLFIAAFSKAQGLEGIIVEKYYVSNAADAAGSVGTLPVGSVTYRVYVDMATGYKFQAAYGNATHTLKLTTTTSFFNNEDRGAGTPNGISVTNTKKNSVMIDSWLSAGATATGEVGVLKTEDSDGSIGNSNSPAMLQGIDASAGIPIKTEDGQIAGTPSAISTVGFDATDPAFVFNATSQAGNSFIIDGTGGGGAWSSLAGASGPLASNRVLIAQITTDGVFHYELNIQIGNGTVSEKYVTSNAGAGETVYPALTGTLGAPNLAPTAGITAPTAGTQYFAGNIVAISDTSSDFDGTVDSVEFFVDGTTKVGVATSSPYTATWVSAGVGFHTLTARATDNQGSQTTSAGVQIQVKNNSLPVVSITAPANNALFTAPAVVHITATASDVDGPVDSVVYFINGVRVGANTAGPYSFDWTSVIGSATITAKAYDHQGARTTSAAVNITVNDPNALPYKLTSITTDCSSSTFCLPLTANDSVKNVIGYDVVIAYDKTRVTPTGVITVSSALINPNYVDVASSVDAVNGRITISAFFNGSAPANAKFSGLGDVFCVGFAKTVNFAPVDTAVFTVVSLQESRFTGVTAKSADLGKYITFTQTSFNGSLSFWLDNSPLAYNSSNAAQYLITNIYGNNSSCTSPSATAVQPDLAGNFTYSTTNGIDININRDIAGSTDVLPVINGFDAFLTKKVLLSDVSFIPSVFQIIAMDVNEDGVISAGDLSQINQRAVLIIPEFKQKWNYDDNGNSNGTPSKDWTFIDATTLSNNTAYRISASYPSNDGVGYSKARVPVVPFCLAVPIVTFGSCSQISNENYKGILIGDVNGNFASVGSGGTLRIADSDKVIFDLAHAVIANGFIDIPVSASSANTINALDFSMMFNNGKLTYNSIVNYAPYLQDLANFNNADQTLRFTSYSTQNYEMGQALLSVRFATTSNAVTASDLNTIQGYLNGDKVAVEVTDIATGLNTFNNNGVVVSVYPNPANDVINVAVSEKATVELMDMNGRSVVEPISVNANQKQVINTANLAAGVYMMKVSSNNFVTVKQVVISK